MKIYALITGLIITAILGLVFTKVLSQDLPRENSPAEAIVAFLNAARESTPESMIPLVTNEPEYVHHKMIKEFDNVYDRPVASEKSNAGNTPKGYYPVVDAVLKPQDGIDAVNRITLIQSIRKQNRYFRKIVNLIVKGNEARARVSLGSDETINERGLADIELDFFLYKEPTGWKVFEINFPVSVEKFDLYKFYAIEK